MASPPSLDFEVLLAPISADTPAGGDLPFDVREKLDDFRKEVEDPQNPENNKKADWLGVKRVAVETLTSKSKHLRPAARLTEALTRIEGFSGLRDGLRLMRRLVEECWDRLNPPIEEPDDVERRFADFTWLDDASSRVAFPSTVRLVPVFGTKPQYSFLDLQNAQENKGPLPWPDFQKEVEATLRRPGYLMTVATDMRECLAELDQIGSALSSKGANSPGMFGLRKVLSEQTERAQAILNEYERRTGGAGAEEAGTEPSGDGAVGTARPAGSREQAYRQLSQAAAVLRQLEPHSPIPYLVDRAVELGALPFPQLIKELVREATVLSELYRLLGIKEETPAS
jgi:type VI secretion system protein ImpA